MEQLLFFYIRWKINHCSETQHKYLQFCIAFDEYQDINHKSQDINNIYVVCTQNQNFASQLKDVRRNFDTTLDPTFKDSEKISLTGNFGWLYDDDDVDNESAELTAR